MAERRLRPAPRAWSPDETDALLEAWAPLHRRRRQAQGDPWVPRRQRRPRALVDEDWRAVSVAVNSSRSTAAGLRPQRTPSQCKGRVKTLWEIYRKDLARPPHLTPQCEWFDKLDAVLAEPRLHQPAAAGVQKGGDALGLGGAAVGDTLGGAAMDGRAAAAAEILKRLRSAAWPAGAEASGGEGPEVGGAAGHGVAATGDGRGTTAARDLFGGPIPKRPRTGSSTSAAAAGAPSVKEELVRQARDAGPGAVGDGATSALGDVAVAVGVTDASLAAWADGRSDNAAVMAALGRFYLELERIDLEKKKLMVAAEAARGGASAGGLP